MNFVDKIYIEEFGELIFVFNENGGLQIYSDSNKNIDFLGKIISLDTNLTCNFLKHDKPIGCDAWYYLSRVNPLIPKNHPGFILEIYKKDFSLMLFRKIYHNEKNFICCQLESDQNENIYDSYYSFFYEDRFKKYFNISETDVVYDLGANIGSFSLAASNYFPKKIYAFEPHPTTFKYLKRNCDRYGINIKCFKKAIWSDFKMINFGGINSVANKIDDNSQLSVHGINLEKFIYFNNLEKPTYLKIDIEGAEYTFFEKQHTSDEFFSTINNIFLEYHWNDGINLNKIIERCKNLGYDLTLHTDNCRTTDYVGFLLFKK